MYNNCILPIHYPYITAVPDLIHFERPRCASVLLLILETLYKKKKCIYKFTIIYLLVFDTLIKKIVLKRTHFNLTLAMYAVLNRVTNRLKLSSYYKSKISGLFFNIIFFSIIIHIILIISSES